MVTCLTRDSYLTHCFLQHLMVVLSSLERTPSPEPLDKDFYSEFGDKNTGILSTPEPSLYLSLTLHFCAELARALYGPFPWQIPSRR